MSRKFVVIKGEAIWDVCLYEKSKREYYKKYKRDVFDCAYFNCNCDWEKVIKESIKLRIKKPFVLYLRKKRGDYGLCLVTLFSLFLVFCGF